MKFFSVFCVVFYVHTGVTLPYQNNALFDQKPTSTKNINFRISDRALDTPNYSNDIPNNLKSQREVLEDIPNIQDRSRDIPRKKDITLGQRGLPSKWDEKGSLSNSMQNPIESISTPTNTLLQSLNNGQSKGLQNEEFVSNDPNKENQMLSSGNIFWPNTNKNLNSNSKVVYDYQHQPSIKQSLKPETDVRLDLQGISLENIKSLISQSSFGNPAEPELPTATDLKKDNSIQNIIKKAKQVHNINHASDKKLKRYTIIHPDGRVEHTDDLEKVYVTYPNYVMVKYSDLSKYNTNISETATELRPERINQKSNEEIMRKTPNNVDTELTRPADIGSPEILPEIKSEVKNEEDQSLYSKKNVPINIGHVRNLDEAMKYESVAPHTAGHSETVSKADFAIVTPTSATIPHNITANSKSAALNSNSTSDPSNSESSPKGNYSFNLLAVNASQDNTNHTPSSKPSPASPSQEDIDYSGIWYQDKDFWDQIKNNAQYNLVFFMYVPTAPQVRKEIKTTIYPNGTTVEEVTEIVDDKDGFPVATKTTTVTLAEDCDTKEKQVLEM